MPYIYIIRSEQWEEDIYKVGYTDNPINRIKDSCYTTTYYKPCKYISIYNIDLINPEDNPSLTLEYKEKLFHKHMKETTNLNLKNSSNCCNEMYKCKLDILKNQLLNFIQKNNIKYENINYDSLLHLTQENKLTKDQSKLIISYGIDNNVIIHHINLRKKIKCSACNVDCIKEVYKITYEEIEYNFGSDCIKLNGAKNYIKEKNEEIKRNKREIKKLEKEKEILESEIDTLREEFNTLKNDIEINKNTLTEIKNDLINLNKDEADNINKINEIKKLKEFLDKEETKLLQSKKAVENYIKEKNEEIGTLNKEFNNLKNDLINLNKDEVDNIKRINEIKKLKELLKSKHELCNYESNNLTEQIKDLTNQKIKLKEEIKEFNNNRKEIVKKAEEEIRNNIKDEIIKLENLKKG